MAWIELTTHRTPKGKVFRDSLALTHRCFEGTIARLHYESALDSGINDQAVNLAPNYVNNAQLDGWLVTQNRFHYALGTPKTGALAGLDGVVGFGGRKGANWFKFRLIRLGYLHNPTRDWTDISGAPIYNRANLTRSTAATAFADGSSINTSTTATWTGIWSTPSGGDVTLRWMVDGGRLKEDVILNQAGREWVVNNRPPTTPPDETYFGFVFRLDLSDIPRLKIGEFLKDPVTDFTDDLGPLAMYDAMDRLLALLPLSDLYLDDGTGRRSIARLRKRFYRDVDGNNYLVVGVRCDVLAGLPAGALIFDPTIDEQVGASADDAYQDSGGSADVTTTTPTIGTGDSAGSPLRANGFRFQTVAVPTGATINSDTYVQVRKRGTSWNLVQGTWYGNDVDDASAFSGSENLASRTLTTATVACNENINRTGDSWYRFPESSSMQGIIAEICGRAGWASGNDIALLMIGNGASSYTSTDIYSYDGNAASAAQLHIDYTVSGTTYNKSVSGSITPSGTATKTLIKSSGARFRGTEAASATTPYDDEAWGATGNMGANDGTYNSITATTYDSPDYSNMLTLSNFGFSLPSDATIDGIVVEIERRCAAGTARDYLVSLTKNAGTNRVGDNKADTANNWPGSDTVKSYGAYNDLWGTTWTYTEINATGFGLCLSIAATSTNVDIYLDYATITVYYHQPSGTAYTQSVSGSVTSSGGIVKVPDKRPAGSVTTSGAIAKLATKAIAGAVATAGAVIKQTIRNVFGSITSSGVLSAAKLILRSTAGSITATGGLVKQAGRAVAGSITTTSALVKSAARSVAGSITTTGAAAKMTVRSLAGSIQTSGVVTRTRLIVMAIAGSITAVGSAVKSVTKSMTGSIAGAGAVVKLTARSIAGSIQSSGVVNNIRLFVKAISGSISVTGSIAKSIARALSGSVQTSSTLIKQFIRSLSGGVALSGSVSALKTFLRSLSGSVTASGSVRTQAQKLVQGSAALAGQIAKRVNKDLSGVITVTGTATRAFVKAISGSIAVSGAITRRLVGKLVSGSVALSGGVVKLIQRLVQGTIEVFADLFHALINLNFIPPTDRVLAVYSEVRRLAQSFESRILTILRVTRSIEQINDREVDIDYEDREGEA